MVRRFYRQPGVDLCCRLGRIAIAAHLAIGGLLFAQIALAQSRPPGSSASEPTAEAPRGDDDWLYGSVAAEGFVREARQYDPQCCPRSQRDREQAVQFYRQAIEAQPGARLNAVLANRIAQLYATYEDREKGHHPEPDKAIHWWTECLRDTDSTQLLWSQAQMGLASMGVMRMTPTASLSPLQEILRVDPSQIQLENWKRSTSVSASWHAQERARLQQALLELQERVRAKVPYVSNLAASERRAQLDAPGSRWSTARKLFITANALLLLGVVGLVARRWFGSAK